MRKNGVTYSPENMVIGDKAFILRGQGGKMVFGYGLGVQR